MDIRELAKIDLNLLISLQVLLEERSVSRAAERLFITQPAMSKTLSRLRILFDDALFTRSSHGMQPTPRVLELAGSLAVILGDISKLVAGSTFNPGAYEGEITLALSEYIGVALLPAFTRRIIRQAPRLNLRTITRVENQLAELAQGNLDFAIQIEQRHYPHDFRVESLGGSPPAIFVRDGHPLAQGPINLERLSHYPLIRLYVSGQAQLNIQSDATAMNPLQEHSQGTLEISHLLTAMEVLRETDFFMPAPAFILQNADATTGIVGVSTPPELDVTINYALVAHQRTGNSPLHGWLWDEITCTIAEMRTPLQRKLRRRVPAASIS